MADRLLVSTAEMEAAITKYENARSILQESFNKLQSAKDHLDRCYKGPAYMVLAAKYVDTYANVKTAENAIETTVQGLRKTISQMDTTEGKIASDSGALEAGSSAPTYL